MDALPKEANAVNPQPGMMIAPHIRLVRKLGEGGMGRLWVADHVTLQTQLAVKLLSPDVVKDGTIHERFRREATAAARLRHPHVVQIFDHGLAFGQIAYIAMELLDGEDLRTRLSRNGPLSLFDTATILRHTCSALSKAHAGGLVHRDIKPGNIFLTDLDGNIFVKVLDFGVAKRFDKPDLCLTLAGSIVGTPFYMSPEQALGSGPVDYRSDLWSMGVVAYRCVTGKLPFDADTYARVFIAIERGIFKLPSEVRAGLPRAVDDWFVRALNQDPSERFSTAKEMSDAFDQAVAAPALDLYEIATPLDLELTASSMILDEADECALQTMRPPMPSAVDDWFERMLQAGTSCNASNDHRARKRTTPERSGEMGVGVGETCSVHRTSVEVA